MSYNKKIVFKKNLSMNKIKTFYQPTGGMNHI